MTPPPIDIRPADLAIVLKILEENLPPDARVWVFGSRANWTTKDSSDLDLAINAGRPLTTAETGALAEAFEESDLPYRVDVVDMATVSDGFRAIIEANRVEVQAGGALPSPPIWGRSGVAVRRAETRTGGRPATTGTIAGDFALSVGMPNRPAPEGWQWTKLTDVTRLETGHTPSRKHPEYWDGDVPWIGIKDATENHGRTIYDTVQHTNELGITNSSARILPENTVCLSRTASVGYVVVMGCPMATSQDFVNWVCSSKLDYRLLKYVLMSEQSAFLRFASGTTHQTIYFPEVKAFHVCLPPSTEQRAIAHILGTLDDKIGVNRKMAATLEAMARALFKSWFVDFDPVRAKAEGRDPGLPPHLAALFPDRLVDTEKGEIPAGWMHEALSSHIEVTKGVSYQGDGLSTEGVPLHNLNSIYEGGGYKYEGIKYYTGDYKPRHVVRPGDVIVANTEQGHDRLLIGYAAIVPKLFGEFGIASHHIYRLALKAGSPFRSVFLCSMLNSRRIHDMVSGYANGTTVNMLPDDGLQMPLVVVPPTDMINAFDTLARNSEHSREEMIAESRTLAALRNALLPQLISGKLRVKDAESFLAERGL